MCAVPGWSVGEGLLGWWGLGSGELRLRLDVSLAERISF